MKHYLRLLALCLLIVPTSCTHKSAHYKVTGDYMVVASEGGFVATTTHAVFLISNGSFREDPAVPDGKVITSINDFHFDVLLPAAKYDLVKSLPSSIPAELLSRNGETIGNYFPDAGHWVVWSSVGGTLYKWQFEGDQSASSMDVQQFTATLGNVYK